MRAGTSSPENYISTAAKYSAMLPEKVANFLGIHCNRSIIMKPPCSGGAADTLNFHCNLALINVFSSKDAGIF